MKLLDNISLLSDKLDKKYRKKLIVNQDLSRALVSFQANKTEPIFRWFKYKEGFSSSLVKYAFKKAGVEKGKILDPFAGVGTTLFVASSLGIDSLGIELLPIGIEVMAVRKYLSEGASEKVLNALKKWSKEQPWHSAENGNSLPTLRITEGAYPDESNVLLRKYLNKVEGIRDDDVRSVLHFAALTILEKISYTRKDGQYLRWDYRSGRTWGKKRFDKGRILPFDEAIVKTLREISSDLTNESYQKSLFEVEPRINRRGEIQLVRGSVLDELPKIRKNSLDGIMTSPPYCNRYDYTRSYALELALLGVNEDELKNLRQTMLSCTVENREKEKLHEVFSVEVYERAISAFQSHKLLQAILSYLNEQKELRLLNNNGIPRMLRNYFLEMCLVIFECARILKDGAPMIMVNDNVRYAGVNIPVDMILSDFAEEAGLDVEAIWVLPIGKGNSSQQMGQHGRSELRKCVYLWRKSKRD